MIVSYTYTKWESYNAGLIRFNKKPVSCAWWQKIFCEKMYTNKIVQVTPEGCGVNLK